jgi:hypothetical protein
MVFVITLYHETLMVLFFVIGHAPIIRRLICSNSTVNIFFDASLVPGDRQVAEENFGQYSIPLRYTFMCTITQEPSASIEMCRLDFSPFCSWGLGLTEGNGFDRPCHYSPTFFNPQVLSHWILLGFPWVINSWPMKASCRREHFS